MTQDIHDNYLTHTSFFLKYIYKQKQKTDLDIIQKKFHSIMREQINIWSVLEISDYFNRFSNYDTNHRKLWNCLKQTIFKNQKFQLHSEDNAITGIFKKNIEEIVRLLLIAQLFSSSSSRLYMHTVPLNSIFNPSAMYTIFRALPWLGLRN